ncbi:hypothetical protein VTN77DRAFT_9374 [Rasamsonia byssochlamydoides]|uniref:uncharacterized protein n=1 Tax=Rasamsonia byssochlamydoides TaxID=89139 RepID=UPI003743C392
MADPTVLIQQLTLLAENPEAFSQHRAEIISLARKAAAALESPFEAFQRLAYSPLPLVVARIAQERGIFKTLVENDGKPTSTAVLAEKAGVKPAMMESLLEYMSTQDMAEQISPQEYAATKLSHMLLDQLFVDGVTHFHDNCLPAFSALNTFLSKDPSDRRTAFQIGQNSPDDFYKWMETRPVQQGAFYRFMQAQFASLPTWLDVIDFENEYAKAADSNTPIFVDVGGGNGQQCVALRKRFPNLKGRVVLQDLPSVLEKAITGDDVERMAYDYLIEQPVKGARAYYFRQILHNNDDETCIRILQSQAPAMDKSSVILIDEKVLPDEKPSVAEGNWYTSALNLAMVAMFNALERREGHWRKLLADAGFEILAIKTFTDFRDSVIVAAKK